MIVNGKSYSNTRPVTLKAYSQRTDILYLVLHATLQYSSRSNRSDHQSVVIVRLTTHPWKVARQATVRRVATHSPILEILSLGVDTVAANEWLCLVRKSGHAHITCNHIIKLTQPETKNKRYPSPLSTLSTRIGSLSPLPTRSLTASHPPDLKVMFILVLALTSLHPTSNLNLLT